MKIHVDQDFMCPYLLFTDNGKTARFEIGDEIIVCISELNGLLSRYYYILNITSKVIILESNGKCHYFSIEELEKRIKI